MSIPIPIPIPLRLFLQYRDQYQYLLHTSFNTNTDTIPKVSKIFDFNTDIAPIPISIAQHCSIVFIKEWCCAVSEAATHRETEDLGVA